MPAPVIVGAVRTPLGAVHGALADVHPTELLAVALRALAERDGLDPKSVAEVICGCVEQVGGQGGNVARGATFAAGWPATVGGTTVDRGTVSGSTAVATAHAMVAAGVAPLVIAAAVDAPSTVPPGAAAMGRHPYGRPWGTLPTTRPLVPPGVAADQLGVSRDAQDDWAAVSIDRTRRAVIAGAFTDELASVGPVAVDEVPPSRQPDRLALGDLPPAFDPSGTVTAGNLAPLADGAAAIAIADAAWAERNGLRALASMPRVQLAAAEPDDPVGAAVAAVHAAVAQAGCSLTAVESVELPESTAATAVALLRSLGLNSDAVNPTGGALALGEPPGATDLRALVTLAHRLARGEAESGLAVASGLGLGAAVLLHRPSLG